MHYCYLGLPLVMPGFVKIGLGAKYLLGGFIKEY